MERCECHYCTQARVGARTIQGLPGQWRWVGEHGIEETVTISQRELRSSVQDLFAKPAPLAEGYMREFLYRIGFRSFQ